MGVSKSSSIVRKRRGDDARWLRRPGCNRGVVPEIYVESESAKEDIMQRGGIP